ncbi:alpha/beta hydrolase [Frankia sp. AgB1.9]|nr:alpha/beta hydrolase [Frankia sp. AgW1.1]MBL7547565.1 alpha/beta hydrolase [Frankia sp. AgB1.9]MBL7622994.1 alpha/beta hydrolase [Frankia sp. AgB1.8]
MGEYAQSVARRANLGALGRGQARRVLGCLVAALAFAAPLAGCSAGSSAAAGGATAQSLAPGAPGSLITATPVAGAPAGITAWRVIYHTRDQNGADVAASGLVLSPAPGHGGTVPSGGRRVVAFGHGTTGVADACAPSLAQPALTAVGSTFSLVQQGYVVAAADYIGLGTPGDHAIYVARPAAQALLDVVRAARALPAAHAGSDMIIWGYSQGGQAALAAGVMTGYAPELRVRGVVAMAPLADLPRSLASLRDENDTGVAYILMAAYGVSVAYPSVNLSADLTTHGKRLLSILQHKCAVDLVTASTGLTEAQVFLHDPLTIEPYVSRFAAQRKAVIGAMPPLLLLQGDADNVIRQPITDGVVRDLCAAGTAVDYHRYPNAGHSTVFSTSSRDMYTWIANRFRADPAPMHSICGPTL